MIITVTAPEKTAAQPMGDTDVPGVKVVPHKAVTARLDNAWLEAERKRPVRTPSHNWHASSLIDCVRKAGYARLDVPPTDESMAADWRLSADIGEVVHSFRQNQLIAAGMVIPLPGHRPRDRSLPAGWAVECDIAQVCDPTMRDELTRLHFSGRMDAVVTQTNGDLAIMDIKTVGPKDYDGLNRFFNDKLRHWSVQLGAYMHFFQAPDGRKARKAFVLLVNRGDTKLQRLYRIDYDAAAIVAELERIDAADVLIRAGSLPDGEPHRGPCFFCNWKSICEFRKGK